MFRETDYVKKTYFYLFFSILIYTNFRFNVNNFYYFINNLNKR